jgi:hypothetical protein
LLSTPPEFVQVKLTLESDARKMMTVMYNFLPCLPMPDMPNLSSNQKYDSRHIYLPETRHPTWF